MLGAILSTLALGEAFLRVFSPVYYALPAENMEYDPETGFRLKRNLDRWYLTDYRAEVRTNGMGLASYGQELEAYRFRVFAVGDSFTQGVGTAPDESYPFQLDLALNFDADGTYQRRFGVYNLGVAGFGFRQSMIRLDEFAGALGPTDTVLFFGVDNDYTDDLSFEAGVRHLQLVENSPRWGPLVPIAQAVEGLQIARRLRLAASQIFRARSRRGAGPTSPAETATRAELQWPKIAGLVERANDAGALLVLTWAGPSDSYDWLRTKTAQEGVPFADWTRRREALLRAMPGLTDSNAHSAGHYRTSANRLIADAFASEMQAQRPDLFSADRATASSR